jgi:hypothetical protein
VRSLANRHAFVGEPLAQPFDSADALEREISAGLQASRYVASDGREESAAIADDLLCPLHVQAV